VSARFVVDLLRPSTPCEPRACTACGRVTRRLTPAEHALAGSKIAPPCRRRGCGGVMWPATDRHQHRPVRRTVREVLALAWQTATAQDERGAPANTETPLADTNIKEGHRP
jgi:hypothetical protein